MGVSPYPNMAKKQGEVFRQILEFLHNLMPLKLDKYYFLYNCQQVEAANSLIVQPRLVSDIIQLLIWQKTRRGFLRDNVCRLYIHS